MLFNRLEKIKVNQLSVVVSFVYKRTVETDASKDYSTTKSSVQV